MTSKVTFQGKEWDAQPILIRDHSPCYTTDIIPIPDENDSDETWMRNAMLRVIQEVLAAKKAGFEGNNGSGDWADAIAHLSIARVGVDSLISVALSYIGGREALVVQGEAYVVATSQPATLLTRECDSLRQHDCDGYMYYLVGGDDLIDADARYFPKEWMDAQHGGGGGNE